MTYSHIESIIYLKAKETLAKYFNVEESNMSLLSKESSNDISKLLKRLGAFFAFSSAQFNESKKEGVEYVSLGAGLIIPEENAKEFGKCFDAIQTDAIKRIKEKYSVEYIVEYELGNHECYCTGDIEPAVDALDSYNIQRDTIKRIYSETIHKYEHQF